MRPFSKNRPETITSSTAIGSSSIWDDPLPTITQYRDIPLPEDPVPTLPPSTYGFSLPEDEPLTDIWGDPIRTPYVQSEPTLKERIGDILGNLSYQAKTKAVKITAGLALAAVLAAGITVATSSSSETKDEAKAKTEQTSDEQLETVISLENSEIQTPDPNDLNQDGLVEPFEIKALEGFHSAPSASELPPILDTPLRNYEIEQREAETGQPVPDYYDQKGEVSVRVDDEYRPKFVGAYESPTGMRLNIYAATQRGQEAALDQEFKINPESIEYVLAFIEKYIQDAPDGPTKESILQNIKDMKSGADDRLYQVVFDVSPTAGCLDASYQLIEYAKQICAHGGATLMSGLDDGPNVNIPIIIGSGTEQITVEPQATIPEPTQEEWQSMTDQEQREYLDQIAPTIKSASSPTAQTMIFGHEVGHGLSGAEGISETPKNKMNTYGIGDLEHKVIGWLMGQDEDKYGLPDSLVKSSPKLWDNIELLTKAGLLKPILEVVE